MATSPAFQHVVAEQLHLALDGSSFVPFYEQIVDQVRTLV